MIAGQYCTEEGGVVSELDSRGIVTLRNLAPELVAVCEAADAIVNGPPAGYLSPEASRAYGRLGIALTALRAKMEGMG